MLAHSAMALWAIVDQLKPLLQKDNVQDAGQVKQLYAMLEARTMTDLGLFQEAGRRGQEAIHHRHPQSPGRDLASCGTVRVVTWETYVMSSGQKTCVAGSKAVNKTKLGPTMSGATKEIMTCTAHTMTNPHDTAPQQAPGIWVESSCSHMS
jgi:hypothetical protein